MPAKQRNLSVPDAMIARYQEIIELIDPLCQEKLNDEYLLLCKELTATLARKRPSPLIGGHAKTWACGIVYTIGFVNFLFDKTQSPHMRADELCAWFGISASTGGNKAKQIRDMLRIYQLDNKWMVPSMINKNPLNWFISVDGFIVDARTMPRSVQEIAFQKGLIPEIPDDGNSEDLD